MAAVCGLWSGLVDSVAFWRLYPVVKLSAYVRDLLLRCCMLNGALLGGSVFVFVYMVSPVLRWLRPDEGNEDNGDNESATWLARLFFEYLWCWPCYVLALVFNAIWYQDMFVHLQALSHCEKGQLVDVLAHNQKMLGRPLTAEEQHQIVLKLAAARSAASPATGTARRAIHTRAGTQDRTEGILLAMQRMIAMASDEIMRPLVVLAFALGSWALSEAVEYTLLRSAASGLLPGLIRPSPFMAVVVSQAIYYVCLASVHSFHAFDYRFAPWRLQQKADFVDQHILYFIGFGLGMATTVTCLSRFAGAAIYAILFPCSVLLTFYARPKDHPNPACCTYLAVFNPFLSATSTTLVAAAHVYKLYQRIKHT